MTIKNEKQNFRKQIRDLKARIPETEKRKMSALVFERIEKLDVFIKAEIVLLFWSMDDEVYTHDFIVKWNRKKKILLPVICDEVLQLKFFRGEEFLLKSAKYPVFEPAGEAFDKTGIVDLAIMPGVAFDKSGNRLGRGKAYYDKLLSHIHAYKIGVCFSFQLFDTIPHEPTDIKMDLVISG
ncbi:MAG: 5-formyltetrahydrofolate cyclo-ligase [Bacteroidales bacterium]|nr:5-formyltetrahydrofolate cyclo-ligase [Bacteroidales bacterium]